MSADRIRSAALAALLAVSVAFVVPVHADEPPKAFDFEAAGGAAGAGPMYRSAVDKIRGHCGKLDPAAREAFGVAAEGWYARNASWIAASDQVRAVALAKVRENGEDADEVDRALEAMAQKYGDDAVAEIGASGDDAAQKQACRNIAAAIADGSMDIERNSYGPAVEMLREYMK